MIKILGKKVVESRKKGLILGGYDILEGEGRERRWRFHVFFILLLVANIYLCYILVIRELNNHNSLTHFQ